MTRERTRSTLRRSLAGQALVMLALSLTALCGVAALAVDASGAWRAHARLVSSAELAKDSSLTSVNALKFSDDPAATAHDLVTDALAADGFCGSYEVTYYELPVSETGMADRFGGVRVELHQPYETLIAGVIGVTELDVACDLSWSVNPYSSSVVWRPSEEAFGRRYRGTIDQDGSVAVSDSVDLGPSDRDALPDDLEQAIGDAVSGRDDFD